MTNNPRSRSASSLLLFVLVLSLATPARAHALYLDPATGSLILQVVAAGVITAWLTVKGSWSRLRNFFSNLLRRSD